MHPADSATGSRGHFLDFLDFLRNLFLQIQHYLQNHQLHCFLDFLNFLYYPLHQRLHHYHCYPDYRNHLYYPLHQHYLQYHQDQHSY